MTRPRSTRRFAAALLLTALSAQLVACKRAEKDVAATQVTVQAEHPEVGTVSEHIAADATLSPLAQAAISPKITAPIKAFYVQRGSHVREGQLLAALENRDLAAQALDSRGQYTAAKGSYDLQTKAQVPEEYAKAELDAQQAAAQYKLQKEIVDARRSLFQQGAMAGREYDSAVAALAQAKSTYDTAQNHLAALKRVGNQASVEQAQGQLSSAEGKYHAAEALVSYSQIRSPISGVVTDRPLFPGETASSGAALITVMDTSSLLAKVHLSQTVAQRLSLGDEAAVTVPGIDTPVTAKVSLISPAVDPGSTTVEVWLRIDNRAGSFKAGTPVRTSIVGRTVPNAIKIPLSAVLTAQDGSKSVMVVGADGAAHKVPVQLGITDGDDVQVTQGLKTSDNVITSGSYGLDDGTNVVIGKAGAGEDAGDAK